MIGIARLTQEDEDVIAYFYLLIKKDGGLQRVFHQGVPRLSWFLSHITSPDRISVAAIQHDNDGSKRIVGMAWVNNEDSSGGIKKSEVAVVFSRRTPKSISRRATKMMLQWLFESGNADIVYATTPSKNIPAILLLNSIGFKKVGLLPKYTTWDGKPCDALVACVEKEQFQSHVGLVEEVKWAA